MIRKFFQKKPVAAEQKKPVAGEDPTSIGNVLLSIGKISTDQLQDALALQEKLGDALLGTILRESGVLTTDDVTCAMKIQEKLRQGDVLSAELDILEIKQKQTRAAVQEVSDTIEKRKQVLRDRNERSDVFLLPLAIVNGRH